jgi:hypothetical protein
MRKAIGEYKAFRWRFLPLLILKRRLARSKDAKKYSKNFSKIYHFSARRPPIPLISLFSI